MLQGGIPRMNKPWIAKKFSLIMNGTQSQRRL